MAIVMNLKWPGVTPEQYDAMTNLVNWEKDKAPGGTFHIAWFDAEGFRVCDVWESAADHQRFVEGRLMPALPKLGVKGQPQNEINAVHAYFETAYVQAGDSDGMRTGKTMGGSGR